MSVAKQNKVGGFKFLDGVPNSKAYTVQQSAGSRLGFRGNEDLGGGLSAQFQIEHRFSPDTGLPAQTFWGGRSYVQLTNAGAGSVYLGRDYSPAFWPAVKSDPFGWDGVGQIGLGKCGSRQFTGGDLFEGFAVSGKVRPVLGLSEHEGSGPGQPGVGIKAETCLKGFRQQPRSIGIGLFPNLLTIA